MLNKTLLLTILSFILGSCSETVSGNTGKRHVQMGDMTITWADFTKNTPPQVRATSLKKDESLHIFSRSANISVTLSNGQTMTPGNCHLVVPATSGELYKECWNKINAAEKRKRSEISFKTFLSLAEQAVKVEGNCKWLGYDQQLDHTIRATGQLASLSDTRLFFAKLMCR